MLDVTSLPALGLYPRASLRVILLLSDLQHRVSSSAVSLHTPCQCWSWPPLCWKRFPKR